MSYATYITDAIVCGSMHRNTSDATFVLFTRDAGMIYATARSVREERSKQRSALTDFSRIRVSLVRGKGGWRIGSVETEENFYHRTKTRETRAALVRMVKLVRQYVKGEEAYPALYGDVRAGLAAVSVCEGRAAGHVADTFALRLLYKLGYIADDPSFSKLLHDEAWADAPAELPPQAMKAIERALAVSHL